MTRRRPLDPRLDPSFRVSSALRAGVPVSRLRAADLESPFYGMRSAAELTSVQARCRAYLSVAPSRFAFSHVTAALLYGVPLPRRLQDGPLHVTVPQGSAHVRRAGVVGHRGLTAQRTRSGLPVVPPETMWCQLASSLSFDELVIAGDYLLGGRPAISRLDRLLEEVNSSSGQRGIALARRAQPAVRAGVRSPRETTLRLVIVGAGLPEPLVGFAVHHDGAFVGTPDLAYPQLRIAIEYEGAHHQTDRDTYEDDIVRRELFRRAGWVVFLVTDRLLARPGSLVGELKALLAERA